MPFEHRHQPLLPRRKFLGRMARAMVLGGALVFAALLIGTLGYHLFGDLGWLDAEFNAAMILTGMGPAAPMNTPGAKIFASVYALFSGIVFLGSAGVFFAPLVHRMLHKFHLEVRD